MTKTYAEARSEVEAALERDERLQLLGCVVVPPDTLRSILAGPPEPSEEEVAMVIVTDPAYLAEVRDEQQTWLAEHIVQIIQKARRA